MEAAFRPEVKIISETFVQRIIAEALNILSDVGVMIENRAAYRLLLEHGAREVKAKNGKEKIGKLTFPQHLVEGALQKAPKAIQLWDSTTQSYVDLCGSCVHFDPGSAALFIHDARERRIRKPISEDIRNFVHLIENLPHFHLQSTALISADVPDACSDSYRLYLALKYGHKPVVTGIFARESFALMKEMLITVRGGYKLLQERPLAIFDACPSPPLIWSDLTAYSVMEAARAGIPSEFVSMPLTGSTAPITLAGAVTQHTAETLSGVVLAQCANPGAPVIWGGSPSAMDLRFGTTPMGAVETMMINLADVSVGKALGLPTHAYMGLSDAKQVDYQAGFESGIGIILAALAGVNVISGPGMLDFESCQSLEKLVLDHEVCGMAYRLLEGIVQRDELMALKLLESLPASGHLLTHPHTLKWFRTEIHSPGKVIDRRARAANNFDDLPSAAMRARQEVDRILKMERQTALPEEILQQLDRMMAAALRKAGAAGLPQ